MIRRAGLLLLLLLLPLQPARAAGVRAPGHAGSLSAAALARADSAFGFTLFRTLFAAQPRANVVLSPLSAALALDMAYDGARGATARGMAAALQVTAGPTAVRAAAQALTASLQHAGGKGGLQVANSLWARAGVAFQPAFIQHARTGYAARVQALDFRSPSAPAAINAWVKGATHGKIPTIVDRIPPDLILYLINAVYFHGNWAQPFNPQSTVTHPFAGSRGATPVKLMSQVGSFPYARLPNAEIISLPYKGGRFSMEIVLPAAGVGLPALTAHLTAAEWRAWRARQQPAYGSISLPRFTLAGQQSLVTPLRRLGMGEAFSDRADFSGMCVQPCRLSQARQKTYIGVDEYGTTAAAVTAIGVSPTAMPRLSFTMLVDRPFLFAITDAVTGATLFLGAVNSPS